VVSRAVRKTHRGPGTLRAAHRGRRFCAALLADRFGESRQSIGLAANNAVVEVFANLDTGTWTVTVTIAGGATCLLASGEAFQVLGESLPAGLPT